MRSPCVCSATQLPYVPAMTSAVCPDESTRITFSSSYPQHIGSSSPSLAGSCSSGGWLPRRMRTRPASAKDIVPVPTAAITAGPAGFFSRREGDGRLSAGSRAAGWHALRASRPARSIARTPRCYNARMAADPLLKWREEFPILSKKTYLISNSLGAMPRAVYDSLKEYADTWARDGVEAWDEWVPMVTQTGDLIGKIINAP